MYFAEAGITSAAELGRRYAANAGFGQNVTDLGPLLGSDARGLAALGAVFKLGMSSGMIMEYFPQLAQLHFKSQVLLTESHQSWQQDTERVYLLRPTLWLCAVHVNYRERIATIIGLSDNAAFSLQGIKLLAQNIELIKDGEQITGLEELLADRTRELILSVGRRRRFGILE